MKEIMSMVWGQMGSAWNSIQTGVQSIWANSVIPMLRHIYEVYSKQQVAFGVSELIGTLIGFAILVAVGILWWKLSPFTRDSNYIGEGANRKYNWNDSNIGMPWAVAWMIIGAAFMVVSVILIGCWVSEIPDLVRHIYNPEYYAIQELTEMANKLNAVKTP